MTSKSPSPVRISPQLSIALSTFMVFLAVLTFTGFPYGDGESWPVLTTLRDQRSTLHILNYRGEQAPAWLYKGAKGVTSILWSILIPMQHSSSIRQRNISLHRRSGYVVILLSIELALAGYYMLSQDMVTSHDNWYHIHKFYGIPLPLPLFFWPTFTVAIWILGIYYFYSLYQMFAAIRNKQVEKHRRWAVFHSMTGYAIPIQRLISVGVMALGWLLHWLPIRVQRDVLRMPVDLHEKVKVELDAIAWTLTAAGMVIAAWVYNEYSRAGLIGSKAQEPDFEAKKIR